MGEILEAAPMTFAAPLNYLLQHVDMNPHATILGVSRRGPSRGYSESTKEDIAAEYLNKFVPSGTKLDELAPPVSHEVEFSTDGTRRAWGLFMWRNWDKFSDQWVFLSFSQWLQLTRGRYSYLKAHHYFEDISKHVLGHHPRLSGLLDTRFAGLVLKVRNTVATRWPHRLIHARSNAPSQADFDNYMSWGYPDAVRWLEWSKVTDVCPEAMFAWLELCYIEQRLSMKCTPQQFNEIVVNQIAPLVSVFYPSGKLVHPRREEGDGGQGLSEKGEAEGTKEKEEVTVEESTAGGESSKKKKKKKKSKKKK